MKYPRPYKPEPVPYPEFAPYFKGHALKFRRGLSGNWVENDVVFIGDGSYAFGGPEDETPLHRSMLAHEMAHFVEIDQRRCGSYGWGLKVHEVTVLGQKYAEPRTRQCAEREGRVLAYQFNLLEHLGLLHEETALNAVKAVVNFTPDWIHIPRRSDPGRIQWLLRLVEKNRKTYTFERFNEEWWRRSEVLKARQQRKAS